MTHLTELLNQLPLEIYNTSAHRIPEFHYITFTLQMLLSKTTYSKCIQTQKDQKLDIIPCQKTTKSMFGELQCKQLVFF